MRCCAALLERRTRVRARERNRAHALDRVHLDREQVVQLRGLADPDVWLPGDLALRRSLDALGSSDADAATRWRPWRSYAVLHLWALAVPSLFTRPATPLPLTPAPVLSRSA